MWDHVYEKHQTRTKGHFTRSCPQFRFPAGSKRCDKIWQQTWAPSSAERFMLQWVTSKTFSAWTCHIIPASLHCLQSHFVSLYGGVFIQSCFTELVLSYSSGSMEPEAFKIVIVELDVIFFSIRAAIARFSSSFLPTEGKCQRQTWWPVLLCPQAEHRLFHLECGWCQDNVVHQTPGTASCKSCPETFLRDGRPSASPRMNKCHSSVKKTMWVIAALSASVYRKCVSALCQLWQSLHYSTRNKMFATWSIVVSFW